MSGSSRDTTRLVERADGWLPAYAIRAQMARWALVDALPELDLADTALDRRAAIEPQEAQLGLDDGGALKSAFEGAQVSYDNVVSLADEELETLAAVKGARAVVAAEREPVGGHRAHRHRHVGRPRRRRGRLSSRTPRRGA